MRPVSEGFDEGQHILGDRSSDPVNVQEVLISLHIMVLG